MVTVGIFIPIYFCEPKVKICLESLVKSDFGGINVFLCLGINGATKEFKDVYLKSFFDANNKTKFKSIHIFQPETNLGKPAIINLMASKYNKFDYLVSIDSDMVTIDDKWLKKFLYSFDYYQGDYSVGALCANQDGENCHFAQTHPDCIKKEIAPGLTMVYTSSNVGVAGGVLMTPRNIWKNFGGYRAHRIYGSDDGHYAFDCGRAKVIMAYIEEIVFFHPPATDKGYNEWKQKAIADKLSESDKNGYFEKLR